MSCALAGFIGLGGAGTGPRRVVALVGGAGLAAVVGALLLAAGAVAVGADAVIA
jgi:hypothetical protein